MIIKKLYGILIILGCCLPSSSIAQIGIQPQLVLPTGYMGAILKKAPGISIGSIENFDEKWRTRIYGNLIYFTPRREVFNIYSYSIEGNTETVYPGTQEINLYLNASFSMGVDRRILGSGNFNWFIGGDLTTGITLRQFESNIPNVVTSSEFDGLPFIGIRGRTGLDYSFDDSSIFIDFTRTYYLNTEASFLSYNDLGLGVRF